jgi:hypothetical protein
VTRLRKPMLEELQRRNFYSETMLKSDNIFIDYCELGMIGIGL